MLTIYFVGLPIPLEKNGSLYGIAAFETGGSICILIFGDSKSTDYLKIFAQ